MKSGSHSLVDLIRDDNFISWVRNPTPESNAVWEEFLRQYPEKRETVEQAREYVNLIAEDTGRNFPSPDQSEKMWTKVQEVLNDDEDQETLKIDEKAPKQRRFRYYFAAASVLITAVFAGILHVTEGTQPRLLNDRPLENEPVNSVEALPLSTKNQTNKPLAVLLKDGSSVILQPGAELVYDDMISRESRQVLLTGSAFFEIQKDTERPFFVYSGPLVTKVLGTSFAVESSEHKTEIKVSVHSGKVSVFRKDRDSPHTATQGIILEKHQNVTFSLAEDIPLQVNEPLTPPNGNFSFEFDEKPLAEVFRLIEQNYGVTIHYDSNSLSDCPLTASLTGQPLHKKLQTISQAFLADYSITGNEVTILGGTCRQ